MPRWVSASSARGRMVAGGLVALIGLIAVLLATRSQRTRDISAHDTSYQVHQPKAPPPPPMPSQAPHSLANGNQNGSVPQWITILLLVIGSLIAAALLALLIRAIVRALRGVTWQSHEHPDTGPDGGMAPSSVVAKALREAVDEVLVTIERGETRDAIIACWLRLEDVAASVGVARQPSETSAELTERVLAERAVSAATLSRLAELYREARFSAHPLGPGTRDEAREALEQVRREIAHKTAAEQQS